MPGVAARDGIVIPGMDWPDGVFIAGLDDMRRPACGFAWAFLARPLLAAHLAWAVFFATLPFLAVVAFLFPDAFLAVGFVPGMCMSGMFIWAAAAGAETARSASALAAANNLVFTESLLSTE